jgi:gliding motility-associated-like protein/uncharacterized repeat protein (TIGR01451 family)
MRAFGSFILWTFLVLSSAGFAQVATVEVQDAGASETGSTAGSFRFLLDDNPLGTTVNYSVSGTATAGADYASLAGSVTFSAGITEVILPLSGIVDDNLVEGPESVTVTITTGLYFIGSPNDATINITDNDVGVISLDLNIPPFDNDASEAGLDPGLFRVNLDKANGTANPVSVDYTITGTAVDGTDYNLTGNVTMTFAANGTQVIRNLNVIPIQDTAIELAETVILTLNSTSNPALFSIGSPNSATVTISDNDVATATIVATDAAAAEATPANQTATFTIDIGGTNNTGAPITVNYTIAGTAINGTDYTLIPTSATIGINQSTATVLITPIDDALFEGSESVSLTLVAGPGYVLGPPPSRSATVNIADNDSANLSIGNVSVAENVAGGNMVFSVTLNTAVAGGTSVGYSFSNGTATGGGVDFTATPGTLTFAGTAGEVETITVAIVNDIFIEGNETFTVQLGTPTNGVVLSGGGTAIGTIINDDNCDAGTTAPTINSGVPTTFCDVIDENFSAYSSSIPPAGTTLKWSTDSNPLNTAAHLTPAQVNNPPPAEGSYYVFFYDAVKSCASPVSTISIVVNTTPTVTEVTSSPTELCGSGSVTLSAAGTDNPTFNWYTTNVGGTPIATGASIVRNLAAPISSGPAITYTFYVEATLNNCFSEREAVSVVVAYQPSAGIPTNASSCSVADNGPTTIDLDDRLTGEDAGSWAITTDPSGSLVLGAGNVVNFVGRPDGNYVFTFTTAGAQAPCTNVSSVVTISVNDCDVDTDGDGIFDGPEATLGTDPNNRDSDEDGIEDGVEVGPDFLNPLDEDSDGIIDALDSNILDQDMDGVVDQLDPANNNPCIPDNTNGLCDTDGDGITDGEEIANGSDPLDACSPNLTPDCAPDPIDLEITKVVDNENAAPGTEVVFRVTVNNLSDSRVLGILIGDLLESGFEFVSASASLGNYDQTTGEWDIFELGPLLSATLDIRANVIEGGVYSNTAELLDSFPDDNNPSNDSDTVTLSIDLPEGIDLLVEKTALSARPLVGDEVLFTIKVTNQSVADNVSQIQIREVIADDSGFEYLSHTADLGTYDRDTGIWLIPDLLKDQVAQLKITVRVPLVGTFENTASLVRSSPADGNPINNEATVQVIVSAPNPAEDGFIFNQFSPNNDGTNDFLKIKSIGSFPNSSIEIFNRYGQLVFENRNMTDDQVWDGFYKNEEAPEGTYFYILNLGDGTEVQKGWIQLIR